MRIDIVSLFPDMVRGPFRYSIGQRAVRAGQVELGFVAVRDFGVGIHRLTDDYPYGGGVGMLMRPEPLVEAVEWAVARYPGPATVVVTAAAGRILTQGDLERWAERPHLVLVAGHYEGIDERVIDILGADAVSVGRYVVTGGEIPAMLIMDGVMRLLPGVLGAADGSRQDSFSTDGQRLEGPQYTRPPVYRNHSVPPVLLSGDHQAVLRWQTAEADRVTRRREAERANPGTVD